MFLYRTIIDKVKTIATFKVKIHKTSDKKKLKEGSVTYDYGAINIRSPELAKYVGKTVKVKIILEKPINEAV